MNIIWIIIVGVIGFVIGRRSVRRFRGQSAETLAELREESREALDERTEKRKEQILEMMKDFEVQQKIVESCDIKNAKKGIKREDVEKRLGVSERTALKYLNQLEEENKIKQIGAGRDVHYELRK